MLYQYIVIYHNILWYITIYIDITWYIMIYGFYPFNFSNFAPLRHNGYHKFTCLPKGRHWLKSQNENWLAIKSLTSISIDILVLIKLFSYRLFVHSFCRRNEDVQPLDFLYCYISRRLIAGFRDAAAAHHLSVSVSVLLRLVRRGRHWPDSHSSTCVRKCFAWSHVLRSNVRKFNESINHTVQNDRFYMLAWVGQSDL